MADSRNDRVEPTEAEAASTDAYRNPINGEPGVRALGTGIGAAGGVTAGAAGGAAAGPVGAVGGVAGGLAGKGIAESIDPTAED